MSDSILRRSARVLSVIALTVAGTASADWELNMPRGVTNISNEVYDLHMLIFNICVVIAVIVFGAMVWSIVHHRKAAGAEPATFEHNTTAEVIWTVIPFIILVAMSIPSARVLIAMADTRGAEMTVQVTGSQWRWNYRYLGTGISFNSVLAEDSNRARQLDSGIDPFTVDNYLQDVDNPLVVPVSTKVRLLITASDVIHSWWVPDFGGKKDAIPGFVNEYWFEAEEIGVYRGQCAELCGRDHGFMPVVVNVVSQEQYDAWVAGQMGAAEAAEAEVAEAMDREFSLDELMARGEQAYNASCAACHQVNGEGLAAANFPPLAGNAIATGDLAAHIAAVLDGRPGTAMQGFGASLNDLDLAAIITYERNAWGNDTADVVQPRDIAAAR
jgi:cytochrome c oxidase subunit II